MPAQFGGGDQQQGRQQRRGAGGRTAQQHRVGLAEPHQGGAEQREQEQVAGHRPVEQHVARPQRHHGEQHDRRQRQPAQQPASPGARSGAQAAHQPRYQPGPDPGQQEQRGAGQHQQRGGEVQLVGHRPSALEGEAGPAMRRVPGQHGEQQQRRQRRRHPGLRPGEPAPVHRAGQQIQGCAGEGEHGGVFRKQRQPGAGAGAEPPAPAASSAGRARIRQHPAPSRAQTSGPSGSTHEPVVRPKTGARFSATAAQSPA